MVVLMRECSHVEEKMLTVLLSVDALQVALQLIPVARACVSWGLTSRVASAVMVASSSASSAIFSLVKCASPAGTT
jgi:hypothetical protein